MSNESPKDQIANSVDSEAEASWNGQKMRILSLRKEVIDEVKRKIVFEPSQHLSDLVSEVRDRLLKKTGLDEDELRKFAAFNFISGSTIDYVSVPNFDLPGNLITGTFISVFGRELRNLEALT